MRDAITITLGAAEYRLLPTFSVVDTFEDRHGSLMSHFQRLMDLSATLHQRAFLILEAMKAAQRDEGKDTDRFQLSAVKERMFEAGMWSDDLIRVEADLCERLLYTPEQYLAKKTQRAEAQKAAMEAMGHLSGFEPFTEPQPQS